MIREAYRDAQHRLLWRDTTCPASTSLVMSQKAIIIVITIIDCCYHYYCCYYYYGGSEEQALTLFGSGCTHAKLVDASKPIWAFTAICMLQSTIRCHFHSASLLLNYSGDDAKHVLAMPCTNDTQTKPLTINR